MSSASYIIKNTKNPNEKAKLNQNAKNTWQMITIAVITYLVFMITSSMATWISFKSDGFSSTSQANGAKGGALLLLIASVLMPVLYAVFAYLKATDEDNPNPKAARLSPDSVLIVIMVTFFLLVVVSSFGIWMTNANQTWDSHQQENGVQIYFIIVLVLAIVLPFLWALFYFRKDICREFMKT